MSGWTFIEPDETARRFMRAFADMMDRYSKLSVDEIKDSMLSLAARAGLYDGMTEGDVEFFNGVIEETKESSTAVAQTVFEQMRDIALVYTGEMVVNGADLRATLSDIQQRAEDKEMYLLHPLNGQQAQGHLEVLVHACTLMKKAAIELSYPETITKVYENGEEVDSISVMNNPGVMALLYVNASLRHAEEQILDRIFGDKPRKPAPGTVVPVAPGIASVTVINRPKVDKNALN
ncbi:MAG: hypothetical protein AB7G06_03785 [Bdellovibrionales bacterium]